MPDVADYQEKLEERLAGLADRCDPMLLSELDGYLSGIVVCPDLIMPSEWLPRIWGGADDEDGPVFDSAEELQELVGLVMLHYNAIVADLKRGQFAPWYSVDTTTDAVDWETWMIGFGTAMDLRRDSWDAIIESGNETAGVALLGLVTLVRAAHVLDEPGESEDEEVFRRSAPHVLPKFVRCLHDWRMANAGGRGATAARPAAPPHFPRDLSMTSPRSRMFRRTMTATLSPVLRRSSFGRSAKSAATSRARAAPARNTRNAVA